MTIRVTDELVARYLEKLTDESKASFLKMTKAISLEANSLEVLTRNFLTHCYESNVSPSYKSDVKPEYKGVSYAELVAQAQAVDAKDRWKIAGEQNATEVEQAIRATEVELPKSLKHYFIEVGAMESGDQLFPTCLAGKEGRTGSIMSHTEHLKAHFGLPDGYYCLVYNHERRYLPCLDLRLMENGECPVVEYNKDAQLIEGVMALNFDVWFRNAMARILKTLGNS